MKPNTVTLLVAAGLGLAATAQADLAWDWTLTGDDTGSGTFTTTSSSTANGFYPSVAGYLVTGATGTFDGATVTGVLGVATAAGASDGGWDQILFPSDASTTGSPVDLSGIVLTINHPSDAYAGFYEQGDSNPIHVISGEFDNLADYGEESSYLTVTPAPTPTPEPSQVASLLALAGLGSLRLLHRRHRRQ